MHLSLLRCRGENKRRRDGKSGEKKEKGMKGECSVIVHLSLVSNLLALQIIELSKGTI